MNDAEEPRETHFIRAGQTAVNQAVSHATPVVAACGKKFIPSRRDDVYPLCSTCLAAITEGWAA